MCGVLGVVTFKARDGQAQAVERGLAALAHRGPDASRVVTLTSPTAACVLGLARLRIIDLSPEADQPLSNEDGSIWVAYNGEIYNFAQLRADLEHMGHRFRSRSDTEVLVHLYEDVGGDAPAMLSRLRGMFAFAIFDAPRGRVLLARDRLGIKPLYVGDTETGGLAFGSEVRALAASGLVNSRVELAALTGYLAWGVVPAPGTIFAGIRELPPGHFVQWEAGTVRLERWWSATPEPDRDLGDPAEAARVMTVALEDSVARHLVADRPVGVFLSSGLDSGAVTTLAARGAGRIRTLTVTFPDVSSANEGTAAARVAAGVGAEHVEVAFTGADAARLLPDALRAMDQPTWDAFNTWILCRAARKEGMVVCLSGLGGDELFGGYPSFDLVPRLARLRAGLRVLPGPIRRQAALLAALRSPGGRLARALDGAGGLVGAYSAVRGLFSAAEVDVLFSGNGLRRQSSAANGDSGVTPRGLAGVGFLEMTRYLPNQLLRDTDAVSMAHSLEVRVPLLDDVVVQVALAVPEEVRFESRKGLLAHAAVLGSSEPKRPFTLPVDRWMAGPLREIVREGVVSDRLPFADLLASEWRQRVWRSFEAGRTHWSRPWSLAVLRLWPPANGLHW